MEVSEKPAPISQKEYLKKYLSKPKSDKVKKKKTKLSTSSHIKRSQIIDDDLNLNEMANVDDEEFNLAYLGDEAPQIAGVIDERPDYIKSLESYGDSKKWKSIGEEPRLQLINTSINPKTECRNQLNDIEEDHSINLSKKKNNVKEILQNEDENPSKKKKDDKCHSFNDSDHRDKMSNYKYKISEKDQTPPRKKQFNSRKDYDSSDGDQSPFRGGISKITKYTKDVDRCHQKYSSKTDRCRRNYDSDESPPRKTSSKVDRQRKNSNSDQSPPRKTSSKVDRQRKNSDSDQSPPRKTSSKVDRQRRNSDSDQSPPRKNTSKSKRQRKQFDSAQSPPRKPLSKTDRCSKYSDSDHSPPRIKSSRNDRFSRNSDSDQSPKNTSKKERWRKLSDSDQSPPRKTLAKFDRQREYSDSDESPPRITSSKKDRYSKYSDSYQSPPRKKSSVNDRFASDSDQSPPRNISLKKDRRKTDSDYSQSSLKKNVRNRGIKYQDSDSDSSISRKTSRRNFDYKNYRNSNRSPSRKTNTESDYPTRNQSSPSRTIITRHLSPSRRTLQKYRENSESQASPYRPGDKINRKERNDSDGNNIHEMQKNYSFKGNKSPGSSNEWKNNKYGDTSMSKDKNKTDNGSGFADFKKKTSLMEKTLEGKKAGLQDAKNLREELATLKDQEEKMFKDMDSCKYGVGREAIVRDRKTGRVKDIAKEQEESKEKMKERKAREEKYSRWGKGLKQLEDASSKAANTLYEMSKPLARYKDDNDLDDFLKAQEREGDPMLDFIRSKQKESHSVEKLKPRYEGSFAPNRFNIRPGHRWDGVDRSNGYECKWFESINAKKAIQEEAYKWSSADM